MSYQVKGMPFVFKGVKDVSDCHTSEEVMKTAHLDWNVAKCNLVAKMPATIDDNGNYTEETYKDCPNAYATYRTDLNIPLGIVKDRYTIVQNTEAFKFFDNAIGKNKALWQTAGLFDNGRKIFVSAKLPNTILVNGDPINNYLVFTTTHDGTGGVKILFTPIRIVCENTLNAAIRSTDNYITFRHVKSVHDNIDIANQILGISRQKVDEFNIQMNRLSEIKMSDSDAAKIFVKTVCTDKEVSLIHDTGHTPMQLVIRDYKTISDAQISIKKVNVISEMFNYYCDGIGQREIIGTGYGVYNAVSGYYSNIDNITDYKRMDSILYGDKSNKIKIAGDLILAN